MLLECLGRVPDEAGINYWCELLLEGKKQAIDVTRAFLMSPEMTMKDLKDADYIKVLYRVYFGREYDEEGLEYWTDLLKSGYSRQTLIEKFALSKEFLGILYEYGLTTPEDGIYLKNERNSLYIPSYITKIKDLYFIVDCYHNQVIYHDNLEDPLTEWNVLANDLNRPHSIASDGELYLIDDTDNNRVLVYRKKGDIFVRTQVIENICSRPHYIQYDADTGLFYCIASNTGGLILLKNNNDGSVVKRDYIQYSELRNSYIRSFYIIGSEIYIVSGPKAISCIDKYTMKLKKSYTVTDEVAGMNQIRKIQDYYYITVSTDSNWDQSKATFIRTRSLERLQYGDYEVIYPLFETKGTPYCINYFDNKYYLTNHGADEFTQAVFNFDVIDNQIVNIKRVY